MLLQKELGDLVFVELPEAGSACKQGEKFASVESVKAVSDVYSPISGTVVEVNTSLSESPDLVSKHTSKLGSLNEIGISIPDKSRFQVWEQHLQSRKSKSIIICLNCQKKAPLCLIAKETINHLLICKKESITCSIPNRRKNHLFGSRRKRKLLH